MKNEKWKMRYWLVAWKWTIWYLVWGLDRVGEKEAPGGLSAITIPGGTYLGGRGVDYTMFLLLIMPFCLWITPLLCNIIFTLSTFRRSSQIKVNIWLILVRVRRRTIYIVRRIFWPEKKEIQKYGKNQFPNLSLGCG